MDAICRNCTFFTGRTCTVTRRVMRNCDTCARFQLDPEYVAQVNAQAMEESQRRLQEQRYEQMASLQRQEQARLEERRKQQEKMRRKEEARLRAAERRENYKEINGEPYTPMAVRAAIGILPHLFKKK